MKDVTEDYILYLKNKKYATNTLDSKIKELNSFKNFIKKNKKFDVFSLTIDDVLKYQDYLLNDYSGSKGNNLSKSTVAKRMLHLKSFNDFLKTFDVDIFKDYVSIKVDKSDINKISLTINDIENILNAVGDRNNFKKHDIFLRNKLIINLYIYLGIKTDSLIKIKRSDVNIDERLLTIDGKNYFLNDSLYIAFSDWIKFLDNEKNYIMNKMSYKDIKLSKLENKIVYSNYIFISQREEYINDRGIHHILNQIKDLVGLEHLSPLYLIKANSEFKLNFK